MSNDDTNKPKRTITGRIRDRLMDGVASVRDATASTLRNAADKIEAPKASFELQDLKIEFDIDIEGQTVWSTQQQMAELFGRDKRTISEHIQTVLREGELDEKSVVRNFRITAADGKSYDVAHYDLDVILAVGMKVKSPRATLFRKWAFDTLKEYIVRGYALNESRLRSDPEALQSLAEKVRALRFEEKSLYDRIRATVAAIASDYDGSSEQVRSFFARMQDKFHWAACQQTSHELLLSRANADKDMMGMSSHLSKKLTKADATVAKNYLNEDELRLERVAGDAFFAFAENAAIRGRTLTTAELLAKIDEVFKFNEMPVFPGYRGQFLKDRAHGHAKTQYDMFRARTQQERYDDVRRP